jgi:hypothetical protein
MKKALPFLFLLLVTISCKEKSPSRNLKACGVSDPIRNLPWLRDLIDKAKKDKQENITTITLVEVDGEQVINYYVSYMSCIGCISYRCDGSRFDTSSLSPTEISEYQNKIWGEKGKRIVLWPEK